jgi:2-dehydro-3-deoxygluconokinase
MNKKVITFGEILLRLSPYGYKRLIQAEAFEAIYAGAEANVAISLSTMGVPVSHVTKIPEHEIGQCAINTLRRFGVDTADIVRGGNRLGIYFIEKGASQRPSKVVYDRAGSSLAEASLTDFDWDRIFADASLFHFSGITPALNDSIASITMDAIKAAKRNNVTVSCDVNYRSKLWSREKCQKVMAGFMPYVDICIANDEEITDVFGIPIENADINQIAMDLAKEYKFKAVAIDHLDSISSSENNWRSMYFDGNNCYESQQYHTNIIDRVGIGDSFAAGLLYGIYNGLKPDRVIEYAVAASALKYSIEGDSNFVTADEVFALAGGENSGGVKR